MRSSCFKHMRTHNSRLCHANMETLVKYDDVKKTQDLLQSMYVCKLDPLFHIQIPFIPRIDDLIAPVLQRYLNSAF